MTRSRLALLILTAAGCSAGPERNQPNDSADEALCTDADGAEAAGVVALVNDTATTVDDLDRPVSAGGAGLDRRAAEGLIAGRPFDTLAEIDAVPFVGVGSCKALVTFACEVQNRCAAACDGSTFEQAPAQTKFDDQCAAMLVDLSARERGESAELGDIAPADHCELMTETTRRAYEFVANDFGSTPDEIEEALSALSVATLQLDGGAGSVEVVDMTDLDSGTRFVVGFAGHQPLFQYTNDGLGGIARWFCGAELGSFSVQIDDCIADIIDTACVPDSEDSVSFMVTAAEAAALDDPLHAAADHYSAANQLAASVKMTISGQMCGDGQDIVSRGQLTVSAPGKTPTTYEVADVDAGATLLTAREGDGEPELLCEVVVF